MGGLAPKAPRVPDIAQAPAVKDVSSEKLLEDRVKRRKAVGTSANIYAGASGVSDSEFTSKISKLLG